MKKNSVQNSDNWRRKLLPALIGACFVAPGTLANPTGPNVVNGQVTFSNSGNVFNITNSPGSIINWQNFSIDKNETTRFTQQSANSWVLNRIIGQDPSLLFGTLQSNGKVVLINPNGVIFGANSTVDTGALFASSLNISDSDFKNGNLHFSGGENAGSVINQGTIRTPDGGQIFLIAPHVENNGIITNSRGEVVLAAGHEVQLVDSGNPNLQVVISAPADQAINLGQIIARGGQVGIYGALIKQQGVINADSAVVGENGKILFRASDTTLLEAGSVTSAIGAGQGGDVSVLGNHVALVGNASVDVSGNTGGGTVLIGGDYHGANPLIQNAGASYVSADANVNANALQNGNGGKVIVWSDQATRDYGHISARGGASGGNGGFVEVSSKNYLDYRGATDLRGFKGLSGTLLLDPSDITIQNGGPTDLVLGGSGPYTFDSGSGASILTVSDLGNQLALGDVTVSTSPGSGGSGDITMANSMGWGSPNNLTLIADRNLNVNASLSSSNGGAITLNGGLGISINATVQSSGAVKMTAGTGGISGSSSIFANTLEVNSAGDVSLAAAGNVGTLAANVTTGGFVFQNSTTPLTIGTVGATSGLTAPGNITIQQYTAGDITVNQNVNSTAGNVMIGIASGNGAVSVGAGATVSGTNAQIYTSNAGIVIDGTLSATSGGATVNAAGGAVALSGSVTSSSGIIGISGTGGVNLTGSASVESSSGVISVTAGSADAPITMAAGTEMENGGSTITLNADKMNLNGMLCAMGGHAVLEPFSTGTPIYVAATGHTATPSQLELTNADLSTLSQSPFVTIGNGNAGAIDIRSPFTAGLTELTLMSGNPISQQPGATLGGSTSLNIQGYSVNLQEANPTGVIAGSASMGSFIYRSSNGIAVNQIDGTNGISAASGIFLQSDSASGIGQQAGAPLTTTGALALKTIGMVNLMDTGNNVGMLEADLNVAGTGTGTLQFLNSGTLDVNGPAFSITGVTTNNQKISIAANGALTISQPVNAGADKVELTSDTLALSATVTASDVDIQPYTAGRNITVGSATCQVAPCLAAYNLFNVNAGTIGIGTTNVSNIPGNIYVAGITPGSSLATDINAGTTRIGLLTGGSSTVTQGGAINVQDLGVEAGGAVTLTAANQVTNLAGMTNSNFSFTNSGSFALSTLTGGTGANHYSVMGVNTNGGGPETLTSSAGGITLNAPIVAAGNSVILNAAGAITNGGGSISASSLTATAGSGIGNGTALVTQVSTFSGTNSGANTDIQINNTGPLTLNNVVQSTGGSTGNIVIDNVGAMTVASGQTVSTKLGAITLTTHSPLTVDGTVSSGGGGNITLTANPAGSTADKLTVSATGSVSTTGAVVLTAGDAINLVGSVAGGTVTKNSFLNTPPPPPPPTLAACIATPSLSGCSSVLPTMATCIATPLTQGCGVVLPTIGQCITTPTASGCIAVLPSLTTCVATPATLGCAVVLPTVAQCTTTPSMTGCDVVLPPSTPTLTQCIATPALAGCVNVLPTVAQCVLAPTKSGCAVVLPTLGQCISDPTIFGCSVELPTLAQCIATPTASGCAVVLPTIAQCTAASATPGCQVVLPSLSQCVTQPNQAGCTVVLPSVAQCVSTPSAQGCSVVLPAIGACITDPTQSGCVAVLPPLAQCILTPDQQGCSVVLPSVSLCTTNPATQGCSVVLPVVQTQNSDNENVTLELNANLALLPVNTGGGTSSTGNGGDGAGENKSDKNIGTKDSGNSKKDGLTKDDPVKKMYCN